MTVSREDLHARIDHLSDNQLDEAAAMLDALVGPGPLPPGRGLIEKLAASLEISKQARAARAQTPANDTTSTPLPLTWGGLLERARQITPDLAFADDVEAAHRALNQPVRDPWAVPAASTSTTEPQG